MKKLMAFLKKRYVSISIFLFICGIIISFKAWIVLSGYVGFVCGNLFGYLLRIWDKEMKADARIGAEYY